MRTALCCALLSLAAGAAGAQEREVTFEAPKPVTVTGFAVGLFSWDREQAANSALASKLAVSLFRPWSDNLYLFGQLTTRVAPGDSGATTTEIEVDNLIVSWTPPGASALNVSFGRFDAPLGFERDDEPLNLIPTNSFNFELARPAKLTGLVARYTLSPRLAAALIAANGWDAVIDNNSGKTGGLRLEWLPAEGAAFGATALYGPEGAATNANPLTTSFAYDALNETTQVIEAWGVTGLQRTTTLNYDKVGNLTQITDGELNRGRQRAGGAIATWTGGAVTAFWRLGRSTGLTVRGEVLDDPDGFTTGTPQTLRSLTVSPWYFYREAQEGIFSAIEHTSFRLPAFALRPALRFDHSTAAFFADHTGGFTRTHVSAVVELVYLF